MLSENLLADGYPIGGNVVDISLDTQDNVVMNDSNECSAPLPVTVFPLHPESNDAEPPQDANGRIAQSPLGFSGRVEANDAASSIRDTDQHAPLPVASFPARENANDAEPQVDPSLTETCGKASFPARENANDTEPQVDSSLTVTFGKPGSLGIEFLRLEPPYVVEQVHPGGLACGTGIEPGHRVVAVRGETVGNVKWDDFVEKLRRRPVQVTFDKDLDFNSKGKGGAAFFSGLAGALGTVAQGVDLKSGIGSKVAAGLGEKVSAGFDLGGKVGGAGLDLGGKVGSAGFGFGSKFYSGLVSVVQDSLTGGDTPPDTETAAASVPVATTLSDQPGLITSENSAAAVGTAVGAELHQSVGGNTQSTAGNYNAAVAIVENIGFQVNRAADGEPPVEDCQHENAQRRVPEAFAMGQRVGVEDASADETHDFEVVETQEVQGLCSQPPAVQSAAAVDHSTTQISGELSAPAANGRGSARAKTAFERQAEIAALLEFVAETPSRQAQAATQLQPTSETTAANVSSSPLPEPPASEGNEVSNMVGSASSTVGSDKQGDAGKVTETSAQPDQPTGVDVGASAHARAKDEFGAVANVRTDASIKVETCAEAGHESGTSDGTSANTCSKAAASQLEKEGNDDADASPSFQYVDLGTGFEAGIRPGTDRGVDADDNAASSRSSNILEDQTATPSSDAAAVAGPAPFAFVGEERPSKCPKAATPQPGPFVQGAAVLAERMKELEEKCLRLQSDLDAKNSEVHRTEELARTAQQKSQSAEQDVRDAKASALEAEKRVREELSAGFDVRIANLARRHEDELSREKEEWEQQRTREVAQLETSIAHLRQDQEKEGANLRSELEQLRFALEEKDKQLAGKMESIAAKEGEVKKLLKELANVPAPSSTPVVEEQTLAVEEVVTSSDFEVMFALAGPLGLEFRQLSAPYVVARVHADRVATGLGIQAGDELIAVAEENVTSASWDTLVERLSKRPVVGRFRRTLAPGGQPTSKSTGTSILSSVVSSAGTSLLSAAAQRTGALTGDAKKVTSEKLDKSRAECDRFRVLLRAKDSEISELRGTLKQREEALRVVETGNPDVTDTVRLTQEKEALAQSFQHVQQQLVDLGSVTDELNSERERMLAQATQDSLQIETLQQAKSALTDRCTSLLTQFESLRSTCESLSLDSQQKLELEGQVQELSRMNSHWQRAHENLTSESEVLRNQATEMQQLQAEVAKLRQFEQLYIALGAEIHEAERLQTEMAGALEKSQQARSDDQSTLLRLQGEIEAMQETGESEAGHLEGEILERNRECTVLRREVEELKNRVEDLVRIQKASSDAADTGRRLQGQTENLQRELEEANLERERLNGVVERCLEKMEKDGRERPHLVDKRMVTQMVAAFLEQRDKPRPQQEILVRMADLLGFTTAEREQVGLSQKRRGLLDQREDAQGLTELTDRFVDFLLEESEEA